MRDFCSGAYTLPDEAASVSRLGMTYTHIPVDFQNPTDDDFDEFCAVMEQLKELISASTRIRITQSSMS